MGACGSTAGKVDDADKGASNSPRGEVDASDFDKPPFSKFMNPKSSHINLDTSEDMSKLSISGKSLEYSLDYCYVSQKGYYPNELGKANQDGYLILNEIMGDVNCHLFGVFDGHGSEGDLCSHFAGDNFGTVLARELRSAGGTKALEGSNMDKIYTNTFLRVNKMLKQSGVDDSLSGTTGVTVLVVGDKLIVGNVGDSRAIIASEIDGQLKYSALSSDQTPFRKDERERLKLRGAKIFTLDQIDGHEPHHENWGNEGETGDEIDDAAGDPPRVWDKTLERPGCAFTRSIGDSVGESVGVFAEPEILTWDLQKNDKFAIIASDGVFEFLPNQAVVDMMASHDDPIEGAKHVVAEAYRLWLQNDERTDDITIILLQINNCTVKAGATLPLKNSPRIGANDSQQARPVRKVMSKSKRKDISEAFDEKDDEPFDFEANASPKTPQELERVAQMVKSNFMFQHLEPAKRDQMFQVMKLKEVKANDMIIVEGDKGDEMYIIDAGEFDVLKRDDEGVDMTVFTYTSTGAAFGELSLMYGKPRAASIRAKTDGKLWCLGRAAFRAVLMKKNKEGLLNLYKSVPLFSELPIPRLQRLCEKCSIIEYKDEEVVASAVLVDEEPLDWTIGVIVSGTISIQNVSSESGKSPRKSSRDEGSYIAAGEIGLTINSAVSEGRSKVAYVSHKTFKELAGYDMLTELEQSIGMPKHRGKPLKRKNSFLSDPANINGTKSTFKIADFNLESATIQVGDYAYIGTFNNLKNENAGTHSSKMIFKKKSADARMDGRLLLERQVLTALQGKCFCVPKIESTVSDDNVILLNYGDVFMCDLALAIQQEAIKEEDKVYYSACLFSAIFALHEIGIMHRFINTGSVYITTSGVPKLADLRYAKKMDGQLAYTICGDPLYFAPEIVKQQGYDYGVDLWALGCTLFEFFEGVGPMGSSDIEETQLFKKINSFEPELLEYTKSSHKKVRSVIDSLMNPDVTRRCGYKSFADAKSKKMFSKIDWDLVGGDREFPFELMAHVDDTQIPPQESLEQFTNETFELF